jgi:DNA-binding NtrC family response regulator
VHGHGRSENRAERVPDVVLLDPVLLDTERTNLAEMIVKRILIVDDEPSILLSLSHLLSNDDVVVITGSRIEEAEEALDRFTFDRVIADISMRGVYGIEGLELLSDIKKTNSETKVIIMTAHGSEQVKESAYAGGISLLRKTYGSG